jgi:hypothetical protein
MLQEIIVLQLVQKFHSFCGNRSFFKSSEQQRATGPYPFKISFGIIFPPTRQFQNSFKIFPE